MIQHFCGGNKAEFARTVKERPQTVSNWMVRPVTSRVVDKIVKAFPDINPSWLQYGNGSMFTDSEPTAEPKSERIQALKEKIMAMQAGAPIAMGAAQVAQAAKAAQAAHVAQAAKAAKATERGLKGIVQRWELTSPTKNGILIPIAKEQPEKGALKAFVEHFNTLARVNPNKAIWLMTGEENGNFVDIAEVMVKDSQIKGLRMVNASLEAENEMLKNKIKELTSISEQLAK